MKHATTRVAAAAALSALLAANTAGASASPVASRPVAGAAALERSAAPGPVRHVLLISIDGMHEIDLQRYVLGHPLSTLAALVNSGTTFTDAHTPVPSDSFPGLLGLVTGGHPASTGVYYEVNYDRSEYPPGSNCSGPAPGTAVFFDESIERDQNNILGGGGLDPNKLTRAWINGTCSPVYPHNYLRVNTIFEVAKAHGGRTAWSDKEESYEITNGPSGHGVDDLYNLEISVGGTTGSEVLTQQYDAKKVTAILNEIDGKTSTGGAAPGTPAIFGMNFQSVSVGQKQNHDSVTGQMGGYLDANGTPSPMLESGLNFVNASLGRFVAEIYKRHLETSTAIIVSAKHGQQPIDTPIHKDVSGAAYSTALAPNLAAGGFIQTDDLALIWLQNRSRSNEISAWNNLRSIAVSEQFDQGHVFTALTPPYGWGRPNDPRIPDFAVEPNAGVIYTGGHKLAEHGGFREDDTHVMLVVSRLGAPRRFVTEPVQTTQVAPTILRLLGLDPSSLQAVQQEGTPVLPGVF